MKFEENLRELRKQHGLSQEELAEKLNVSRQSISKYENGSAYPELDKILALCELFQCSVDDLLKGDVKEKGLLHKEVYDQHENEMSRMLSLGISLILFGMAMYCLLESRFTQESSYFLNMMFMMFVAVAVLIFVYFGLKHSRFLQKYKQIPQNIYTEEELDAFHKRFQIAIAIGIGLLFTGMILYLPIENRINDDIASGFFMLLVTVAVSLFVYYGTQKDKYDKTESISLEIKKEDKKIGKLCGCVMLCTLAAYLLWSFLWDSWQISWILFPIGGILCGIIAILFAKDE